MNDLYFYKGKFRTENGLKRALIKDDIVDVSAGTFYLLEDVYEYSYPYGILEDMITDKGVCERKDFRKWLNKEIKEGRCQVFKNQRFYSSFDYTDNIGTDWWDCLECILDSLDRYNPNYPDDFIETDEQVIESYADEALTQEQFDNWFVKLSDEEQFKIASKWRIDMYKKDMAKLEEAK